MHGFPRAQCEGHRGIAMRHVSSVGMVELVRSTEAFIGVAIPRGTAPKFCGPRVVPGDYAVRRLNCIGSHRQKLNQMRLIAPIEQGRRTKRLDCLGTIAQVSINFGNVSLSVCRVDRPHFDPPRLSYLLSVSVVSYHP